jgi:hypothetical protein
LAVVVAAEPMVVVAVELVVLVVAGIVIVRYPNIFTISIGGGLTGTTALDGAFKVTTFTAGTGNGELVIYV